MTRRGLCGCALVMLLAGSCVIPARGDKLTKAEVAKLGKAATVLVVSKAGSGSGFCVHPSGLFVTNEHVVRADGEVEIVLNSSLKDQKVLKAKVLRSDKKLDLALLQVAGEKDLPALSLGNVDNLTELTEVVACGFPFGKRLATDKDAYPAMTISAGTVTALRLKEGVLDRVQLDVELNPGNSGGPLLDLEGKVVGVVASGVVGARVNFAIPVSHVARFVEAPELQLTPLTLTRANQHQPVEFEARSLSVIPPAKPPSLELVLRAGGQPERRFKMELKDGVYRVKAVAVPQEEPRRVELAAQFETGSLTGLVEDRDLEVGAQKVKLSACGRIQFQPKPLTVLGDGKTVEGVPSGLDKVAVLIGGQTLTVDLSRATVIQVQGPTTVAAVDCTVIARQEDREIGRVQARLPIGGVGEAAGPSQVTIQPPRLEGETVVKNLPDVASDICVGGGGRYLILHLPKLRKLAIFDANEAAVTRYLPLSEDKVVFAAGLEKLVVGLCGKGVVERWNLQTGEKELSVPIPGTGDVTAVLMGAASRGPVMVNSTLCDLQTLKPLPLNPPSGIPGPYNRVSADGKVFGAWSPNFSPAENSTFILQGHELKHYAASDLGHIVPGPDGRYVYTAKGPYTNQLRPLSETLTKAGYCLPAVEGEFFLSITPANETSDGTMSVYLPGSDTPLLKGTGFTHNLHFDSWDRNLFGPWKRVFFIPRAKVIVILADSNDRLEVHRFDVEEALDKSGIDYLLVTSRPPATAKRGAEYAYQVVAKSKQGDVKFQLSSGPPGMEVSSTGLVNWKMPADFREGTSDVILTLRDKSGKEIFHTFTIRIVDE